MPKKIKKKGGKGKKVGKKGKSKAGKAEYDDILKQAIANAHLWENKLGTVQTAKNEYRENTRTLLRENEDLQLQVEKSQKETVQVISFLKEEDIKKDAQINRLQAMVKDLKKEYRKDKQNLISEYTSEIDLLQASLGEKN